MRDELKRGTIAHDGQPALGRAFVGWFAWSPFASAARAGLAAAR